MKCIILLSLAALCYSYPLGATGYGGIYGSVNPIIGSGAMAGLGGNLIAGPINQQNLADVVTPGLGGIIGTSAVFGSGLGPIGYPGSGSATWKALINAGLAGGSWQNNVPSGLVGPIGASVAGPLGQIALGESAILNQQGQIQAAQLQQHMQQQQLQNAQWQQQQRQQQQQDVQEYVKDLQELVQQQQAQVLVQQKLQQLNNPSNIPVGPWNPLAGSLGVLPGVYGQGIPRWNAPLVVV